MQKNKKFEKYGPRLDPHALAIVNQAIAARASGRPMADPLLPAPLKVSLATESRVQRTSAIAAVPFFHSISAATGQLPLKATEAVMIIGRLGEAPAEKIVVIKDYDRPTLGFPLGGVETGNGENGIVDKDKPQACRRELLEEIFGIPETEFSEDKAEELGVAITENDFVGEIRKATNHTVYVYAPILPASCRSRLKPGQEQQAVLAVSPLKIDEYIEEGIFLETHAKGWKMFKQRFCK